jgi:N-carbamoylputrescine amidase
MKNSKEKRIVKIVSCAVDFGKPDNYSSDIFRQRSLDLVEKAGQENADIVCLPEFSAACLQDDGEKISESIPGPATKAFAGLALRYNMYVLVPLMEKNGNDKPYNTVVILDRQGQITGKYRKTHLCMPDYQEGEVSSPGHEVPVFETDFGTIGIAICMDIHYPELFTTLALKGAEIIFWPTAAMDYTGDSIESLVNARAFDNQVYFVCSHYSQTPYLVGKHYGRSRIVDPMGRIRADTGHFPGIAIASVDLNQTYPTWYQDDMGQAYPTMRETLFKTRRPELYGELTKPVEKRHWDRNKKDN